jgi:hypothetical protein
MDLFVVTLLLAVLVWSLKSRRERGRIALLAAHLRPYDIEALMQTLSEGYLRALGESDGQRRQAIWTVLEPSERRLAEQFAQFAADFARLPAERTRIVKLPWPLAWLLEQAGGPAAWLERSSIDMRALVQLHARALSQAAQPAQAPSASAKAYTLLAEILLMQHSCHWFCKSQAVAGARLLARHQSAYRKVLDSVDPATRQDYARLTGQA